MVQIHRRRHCDESHQFVVVLRSLGYHSEECGSAHGVAHVEDLRQPGDVQDLVDDGRSVVLAVFVETGKHLT